MGVDALAYLWYGTKPHDGNPTRQGETEMGYEAWKKYTADLKRRGAKLVEVHYEGASDGCALAVPHSYHHHDWDNESKPFKLKLPSDEDIDRLRTVAKEIGWPWNESELGWYQAATMW